MILNFYQLLADTPIFAGYLQFNEFKTSQISKELQWGDGILQEDMDEGFESLPMTKRRATRMGGIARN